MSAKILQEWGRLEKCVKLVLLARYMVSSSLPMEEATDQIGGGRSTYQLAESVRATIPRPFFPGITRNR
jgi:hypothetical protein